MSQINLNQYIEEVRTQLNTGQYSQVIANCRQILKSYPRYIEAYRLMGEALAAKKSFKDAENILYRVLSIDISNFSAHKTLANVFAETNQLEKAIWHIEHAFEIDPNDSYVMEVREQYYRRAGIPAPVVKGMPLASVARLYVKGGIYDQAIEELNRMLAHNPDRLDWKTLLAVAYWREGKNTEALQLAESLLERLPNNYHARLILGDIWFHNGRSDISAGHLEILQQILLIDAAHKNQYPLVSPILDTNNMIPSMYPIETAEQSASSPDWASSTWEADVDQETKDNVEFDEVLSALDEDDDSSTLEMEPLGAELDYLDYDEDALGTGSLDSFANDLETIGEESAENDALGIADNPDPLSDSELNKLPDIDNLMAAEIDHTVNAEDATVESISDELDALSVNSIEELAELDRARREELGEVGLSESDFGLSDDDFGLSEESDELGDDDFFIDLTLDEEKVDSEDGIIFETADFDEAVDGLDFEPEYSDPEDVENLIIEADPAPVAEPSEQLEDLFAGLDSEISATDEDDDVEDSLDWLDAVVEDEPDPLVVEEPVSEMPDLSFLDEEEAPSTIGEVDAESETGFTDWLDAVELDEEPSLTDGDAVEEIADEPSSESLGNLDFTGDASEDALASGLFDFLSDEENQLNPLPQDEIDDVDAIGELKETDWEIEFDEFDAPENDEIVEEVETPDAEIIFDEGSDEETFSEPDEDFLGDLAAFGEELSNEPVSEDDPFDTSWLDGELTEEIDLLSETLPEEEPPAPAEVDLKSFADTLEGDFDRLAPSDTSSDSDFDFLEDSDPVFASIENQIDSSDLDLSAEAADLNEMLEAANDEVRNAEPEPVEEPEALEDFEFDPVEEPLSDAKDESFEELLESIDEGLFDEIEDISAPADQETVAEIEHEVQEQKLDTAPAADQVEGVSNDSEEEDQSSLDWLIPEDGEGGDSPDASAENTEEDLGWLSLLDEGIPESEQPVVEAAEPNLPWTGDLSSAASAILMPDETEDMTKELSDEESPDWLNEFPEYNTTEKQTDKLPDISEDGLGNTKKFTDDLIENDPVDDEPLDFVENDQEFDPIVFEESSTMQLPDWLSDSTVSASLGYEPEPSIETISEEIETNSAELESSEVPNEVPDANETLEQPSIDSQMSLDKGGIDLEDDLDMEFDKNGNPIPPESQDLEDTLNWLEELATLDLEDSAAKMAVNVKKSGELSGEKVISENDDPLSEIFSGGSALHAFANLESEASEETAQATADSDQEEVSEETLSWLDNLFSSPDEAGQPAGEVADLGESIQADEIDLSIEDDLSHSLGLPLDEEDLEADIPSIEEVLNQESLSDALPETLDEGDDFNEIRDLVVDDLELEDAPDLIEDAIDVVAPESIEESDQIEELFAEVEETAAELPEAEEVEVERPAASGGLFGGADDITVTAEEINQAAEHGDVVLGMEDVPDDPDELMAWLNLDSSEDSAASAEMSDDLAEALDMETPEAVESFLEVETDSPTLEAVDEAPAEVVEVEAEQRSSSGGLFGGADDITVTAEEINQAAEHGDVVLGMEDVPDDPDELMAWLNLDLGEDPAATAEVSDDLAEALDMETPEAVDSSLDVEAEPPVLQAIDEPADVETEKRPSSGGLFGGADDITVTAEEIDQAAEHGDVVLGMEDVPDDPDELMAWLNLEPEVDSSDPEPGVDAEPEASELEVEVSAAEEESQIETEAPVETKAKKSPSLFGDADDITVSAEEISAAVEHGDVVPGMEDIPDDPDALMAWLDLSPTDSGDALLEDDIDLGDAIETSEADLIIADLGQDSEPVLEAKVGTSDLNLDSLVSDDGLDDLFDEIAGPEGVDITDEDLIFGDLGTGRLSGSDWLDKMTFDSDPALLGDVPTVLPTATDPQLTDGLPPKIESVEEILEGIEPSDESAADELVEAVEAALEETPAAVEDTGLADVEELPDDPDEFLRILESNVDDVEDSIEEEDDLADLLSIIDSEDPLPEAIAPAAEETPIDELVSTEESDIPDWLQVQESDSDPSLPWLDEASPSGVMSWLDADQELKAQNEAEAETVSGSIEESDVKDSTPEEAALSQTGSLFDSPATNPDEEFAGKIELYKEMLSNGDDLPNLIRQIRESLSIKNDPTLQKILGDAYMETGQLQDALDAYRQAQRML